MYYNVILDEIGSDVEVKPMAGIVIDAGGEVVNATLPERYDAFDKKVPDQMLNGLNGEASPWDENDKLVHSAKLYSESKSIFEVNHPLMIMVKEKRVVSM